MKTFCIYIVEPVSVLLAQRCVNSGKVWGVDVELFDGVQGGEWEDLPLVFEENASDGLRGCFSSHYKLWEMCSKGNEHFVILEHDAVIQKSFDNLPRGDMLEVCQPEKNWVNSVEGEYRVGKGGHPRGTTGYMVSPKQAEKFVELARTTKLNHADIWMGGATQRIHAILPYPVRCEGEWHSTIHSQPPLREKRKIIRKYVKP